jgi:hypothetical protein
MLAPPSSGAGEEEVLGWGESANAADGRMVQFVVGDDRHLVGRHVDEQGSPWWSSIGSSSERDLSESLAEGSAGNDADCVYSLQDDEGRPGRLSAVHVGGEAGLLPPRAAAE